MPPPLGATPLPLGPGKNVALAGRSAMKTQKTTTQIAVISNRFFTTRVIVPSSSMNVITASSYRLLVALVAALGSQDLFRVGHRLPSYFRIGFWLRLRCRCWRARAG